MAAALSCGVFYVAYGEWFSFLLLAAVLLLPWLSLLLSLPAILKFRMAPAGEDSLFVGMETELWLVGSCPFPMPPFKGKIKLRRCITGDQWYYKPHKGLEADHCGGITAVVEKGRVCDYLGLFSFPIGQKEQKTILIRPRPVPLPKAPDLSRCTARAWKPKFGGGFAENHELRLYRPGDSLNQVHWKLSAKTGKLIIREPMEPQRGLVLLTMTLRGTPEELDRKFGRLLWLGLSLLKKDVHFEIRALTAEGVLSFPVTAEPELNKAIDSLLCSGMAEGSIENWSWVASWQYHIGGEPNEA